MFHKKNNNTHYTVYSEPKGSLERNAKYMQNMSVYSDPEGSLEWNAKEKST